MKLPSRRYRPTLTFAVAALLATLPAAFGEDTSRPPAPTGAGAESDVRAERMQKRAERMADELGLTAEQRVKFKDLMQKERTELQAIHEGGRDQAQKIRDKYREQRQALMTPEQRAKADKMRERWESRRGRHGDGPPHDGPRHDGPPHDGPPPPDDDAPPPPPAN